MTQASPAHPAQVGVFEWGTAFRQIPKAASMSAAVVAVALSLALFADYPTGRNAFPSRAALALAAGVTKRTVSDALTAVERAGWIEQTGTLPSRVKVWRLSIPATLPLVFPKIAAAAGVESTAPAPAVEPATGESGARGGTEQHQGGEGNDTRVVKETAPGGEGNSTRTSALTSAPTSPDTSSEQPAAATDLGAPEWFQEQQGWDGAAPTPPPTTFYQPAAAEPIDRGEPPWSQRRHQDLDRLRHKQEMGEPLTAAERNRLHEYS